MFVRLKIRFWIGSELLRFDKPASKGAFRPPPCAPGPTFVLLVLCPVVRAFTLTSLGTNASQVPPLYAKPEEKRSLLSWNLKEGIDFIPLCSRSKPLYTAPAKKPPTTTSFKASRPPGTSSWTGPSFICSHCLQQKGLGVACTESLACL